MVDERKMGTHVFWGRTRRNNLIFYFQEVSSSFCSCCMAQGTRKWTGDAIFCCLRNHVLQRKTLPSSLSMNMVYQQMFASPSL
jgi:hypothetical protein